MKRSPLVTDPVESPSLVNRRLTVLYRAGADLPKNPKIGDLIVFDLSVRGVFEWEDGDWMTVSPVRALYNDAIKACIDAKLIERRKQEKDS